MSTGSFPGVPSPGPARAPAARLWYVVYCLAMALLYLVVIGAGGLLIGMADAISAADRDNTPPGAFIVMGGMFIVVSAPLLLFFVVAACWPRGPFGWIVGLLAIGIGLMGCTVVAAAPLLVFWLQDETKQYYYGGPRAT